MRYPIALSNLNVFKK